MRKLSICALFILLSGIAFHTVNAQDSAGYQHVLYMAEYYTIGDEHGAGNTVFFSNHGNHRLGTDFVPFDSLDGTADISYYVDDNRPPTTTSGAETAIDSAMATWDSQTCSRLGIYQIPYDGRPTGLTAKSFGFVGSDDYVADVVHNGWIDGSFFDHVTPGGSSFMLAVTFTIITMDSQGQPVDADNNHQLDVAWREIYYNNNFAWHTDGSDYDIETVALHESGHGLSQAHFGRAFRNGGKNSALHFAPRAVMNAAYAGVQRDLLGSDIGGHCNNWAQWPSR